MMYINPCFLWVALIVIVTLNDRLLNVESFRVSKPNTTRQKALLLQRRNQKSNRNTSHFMSTIPQVDAGQYWRDFDFMVSSSPSSSSISERKEGTVESLVETAMGSSRSKMIQSTTTYGEPWMEAQRKLHYSLYKKATTTTPAIRRRTLKTVPSTQEQLPTLHRIAKAVHEESLPWTLSLVLASITTYLMQSTVPFYIYLGLEVSFLIKCTLKYLYKFNVPTTPEPLLGDREWNGLVHNVWTSNPNVQSCRTFLMGYFYDAPFHLLRREDALCFLAWMRYGLPLEGGYLSNEQVDHLLHFDLLELEKRVNDEEMLPLRRKEENPLPCMRFNIEPLRYRHKPIIFYVVTHGVFHWLQRVLQHQSFVYVQAQDAKKNLSYWYRRGKESSNHKAPLVFVHGCGGMAFYYNLIHNLVRSVNDDDVPIILIELPHVSLRVCDDIPDIHDQIDSLCTIMDRVSGRISKATFVGHSFGSIVLSWMIQSKPERVGSCVFIDPICFQLHLNSVLFNFHMQRVDKRHQGGKRWINPFSIEALINLAGTEMHTNTAMLRKFSWATNILFPQDLINKDIPTAVLLSELDDIVPSSAIEQTFRNAKDRKKNKERRIIDCQVVKGARHGDMILNPDLASLSVAKIIQMMREGRENHGSQSTWVLNTDKTQNQKDLRWESSAFDGVYAHTSNF